MWNEIRINLNSARSFFLEFFVFDVILIIIFFLLFKTAANFFISILIIFILSFIILLFLGKRRIAELNEIKTIIYNIRKNIYTSPDEIKLSGNLYILQDEIKKMFDKILSDITYLKRLERIRTEFLANVSHELRTPIFAIQGYVETLLDGAIDNPEVNKHFLEKANRHTISLSNLLNDLIDISMIESGEMRMSFRYFNINEYIGNFVQEFKVMAEEKNIELLFHPSRESLQLFGDKDKLKQVMTNLLTNAIKYTEEGKVEIFIEEEQNFGNIIISDTGIGIQEEDLKRIFERFYRVDKARSKAVGGTGLGLAIVKHIIEAHGSTVEVESKLNEGSKFSFKLRK